MQLIGMLDSPYVRRVAITLRLLGLPFEHLPISVFRHMDRFAAINPVIKVPTLVCDDGAPLMDSSLIIDWLETLAGRSLWPAAPAARLRALRRTGLALAACEKTVQVIYEHEQRPRDKVHGAWLERVMQQQRAALHALDAAIAEAPPARDAAGLAHDGLVAAVLWTFLQLRPWTASAAADCHALAAHAQAVERLPVFLEVPADENADVSA